MRRAEEISGPGQSDLFPAILPCDAEIGDLDFVVGTDEQIVRFDIPVDGFVLIPHVGNPLPSTAHPLHGYFSGHGTVVL